MSPVSAIPAIIALFLAIGTIALISKFLNPVLIEGRYIAIDGLRGYLAFFVFLHHSCIWYFYLHKGVWETPPSNLYSYFGTGSVMLFFMVTGFLFFSKLLDGRASGFNWLRLYVSRFCRIAPLYFFVILLVFLVIAWISRGRLNVPILELLKQMFLALGLGIFGLPNLNGVKDSFIIVAGVLWTLPYEWFFYCSLPALAFFLGVKTPKIYFLFPVLCILFLIFKKPGYAVFLPFISGIISAILVRFEVIRTFMAGTIFSFVMMLCLVVVITKLPLGGIGSQFLLAVVFLIIASGNTLFGVFTSRASRILGEISFSIYLLHGIFLFFAFNFIVGVEKAKEFSTLEFYFVIFAISPILILTSYLTYSRIERPAMLAVARISSSLVAILNKHGFAKSSY